MTADRTILSADRIILTADRTIFTADRIFLSAVCTIQAYRCPNLETADHTTDLVIRGIIPVFHRDASVLFDPSSTYSYVSSYFSPYFGISRDSLSSPVYVSTLVGDSIVVDRVYRSCLVVLGGFETRADLLLLSMVDFDIILGMD